MFVVSASRTCGAVTTWRCSDAEAVQGKPALVLPPRTGKWRRRTNNWKNRTRPVTLPSRWRFLREKDLKERQIGRAACGRVRM